MNTNVKEVIEFWKFLEILQTKNFYPQKDEKENKNRKCKVLNKIDGFEKLKQENRNDSDLDFCCYSIKKSVVEEYFIKEKTIDEKRLEISNDYICLFGFQVDCNFNYNQQMQSFYVSPYIWFLNEILQNNTSSFDKYREFNDSLKNQEIKNILENENINLFEKIKRLKEFIINEINLLKFFDKKGNINDCIAVYYSSNNDNSYVEHESQLFNSYIIDDLELVSQNLSLNRNITDYLLSLTKKQEKTIDVKKDTDEINRILSKDKYPLGKWPSNFSPALMQQLAVNYAIEENRNPFFSVNGPPGTGKTTLLKEIIADTIVKRAIEISKLSNSDDAFYKTENNEISFYKIKKSFIPYSILVTSCNNAAVENITRELPKNLLNNDFKSNKNYSDFFDLSNEKEKLSYKNKNDELVTDTYFNQLEADFCNYKKGEQTKEILSEDVWGCISAPLGKKSNIDRFFNTIISGYLDLMDEKLVRERIYKENFFYKAKKEFYDQLKIVKHELCKIDSNVTLEYLCRIKYGDIKEQAKVQTERPSNLTEKYDIEREKLFCKAINLQKAFVLTSTILSKNLSILRKCFIAPENKQEKLSENQKEAVFTDCFLSLFFLVPVISSTFASIQKMLKYIKEPKKIGTLIIDESGQATPQQALGAIYRSQKFVIVGDPMQVEPVVTTSPEVYEDFLKDNFSLFIEKYASSIKSESVQTYADRLNPYGSYIKSQTDSPPVWVGCPLIVHRRCINPMFDISNELSYGGTMINCARAKTKEFLLQESCWIDIAGKEVGNKNHFVKEQYEAVINLLERKKKTSGTTVFIITPFVSVKSGFKNIKEIQVGTVHTFQGKEADEVFLVLGCDNHATGAVAWVNANIINVAVTRAEYRLYVLGDWNLWSSNKNVAVMQKHLPIKKITDFIPEIKQEESTMSEQIKNELINISEKIEQMEKVSFEKGRTSAFEEIAEKMKNEKIPLDVIEKITGKKIDTAYTYEEFLEKFPQEEYEIQFKNLDPTKKWANFSINDLVENVGWNIEKKSFAKTINELNLSKDFIDAFKNLLSTLTVEQIEEYWS